MSAPPPTIWSIESTFRPCWLLVNLAMGAQPRREPLAARQACWPFCQTQPAWGDGGAPLLAFRLRELKFVEFRISPAGPKQLCVGARFDNASLVQYHNEIGPLHGGEAVGDADRRAALHQLFERRLDDPLGFGIERAGGFVQDQNRRVLKDE